MSEKETAPETTYGINITVPNLSKAKFEAIKALAESNLELAKALNSVNLHNTISNNTISNAEIGINFGPKQTDSDKNDWDNEF